MKKNKILIHSLTFSPDGVSTAYLYSDVALGLKAHGFEVSVLTTTPHYNLIPEELQKQPLQRCWGGLYYKSDFHGITVYHVPQKKFKRFAMRVAGFIYWHILTLFIGLAQRNVALILSPSPPLTIGLVSIIIARFRKAKCVYNVQEVYPDFLINQGKMSPRSVVIRMLKWLERFVYNHSDAVTTIDQVFYNTIRSRFREPGRLSIIPNFVDTEVYRPVADSKMINRSIFPHTSELKVMYAGNIGHAQDWAPLIAVAKTMKGMPVRFFVIGEGVWKEQLEKDIASHSLDNIWLLPYQPRHTMADIVSYADIHFIFMTPEMEAEGFPSKVYTIMACQKPLLIASGALTPLYQFLKNTDCAFLVTEKDFGKKCTQIASTLEMLTTQRALCETMGKNGYEIIIKQYSKEVVIEKYVQLCEQLIASA